MIYGNATGGFGFPKTYILTDEGGNEITGVVVGKETVFDATDNDVRSGIVYASDGGVSTGTKNIPAYHTSAGKRLITAGSNFIIPLSAGDRYDYTELQVIICEYNTSLSNSFAADRVGIQNSMYTVQSNDVLASIIKNHDDKTINLGIVNNTDRKFVLRYFTYKEEY